MPTFTIQKHTIKLELNFPQGHTVMGFIKNTLFRCHTNYANRFELGSITLLLQTATLRKLSLFPKMANTSDHPIGVLCLLVPTSRSWHSAPYLQAPRGREGWSITHSSFASPPFCSTHPHPNLSPTRISADKIFNKAHDAVPWVCGKPTSEAARKLHCTASATMKIRVSSLFFTY